MTGIVRPAMLADRLFCSRCKTSMHFDSDAGFRWYVCQCPRRVAVDDLDRIVVGLTYEYRRQLGDREFLTLDEESVMISRLVVTVQVGLDWSQPIVHWAAPR